MKVFFVPLIILLSVGPFERCPPTLTKDYISSVQVIAIAKVEDRYDADLLVKFVAVKVYKGFFDAVTLMDISDSDIAIEDGEEYLIYTNLPKDFPNHYRQKLLKCSRTMKLTDASPDLAFLDDNINCFDKSLIVPNGACNRISAAVCGCDGNTYYSSCDAWQHGVAIYTAGECKTH